LNLSSFFFPFPSRTGAWAYRLNGKNTLGQACPCERGGWGAGPLG
jgi:hypothetical protein